MLDDDGTCRCNKVWYVNWTFSWFILHREKERLKNHIYQSIYIYIYCHSFVVVSNIFILTLLDMNPEGKNFFLVSPVEKKERRMLTF